MRIFYLLVLATALLPAFAIANPMFKVLYPTPATDEGKLFSLEHFYGQPLLIAFWRSDCAPCITERPILAKIAAAHPNLQMLIISLDDNAKKQHFKAPAENNMTVLLAQDDAEQILKSMGDLRAALPFSVFLHADGSVCETHYGLLGTKLAHRWAAQC